ncbi:MAG TPA: peptide ABC transporter substrate-binding protein [Chthoniobacteraceae bacterium]|jgi:oligopeptide transport system substrate-binding protein|nr:peptide ABC transporter substrate-binding protein [Chthoniobacteraceae bacterium]
MTRLGTLFAAVAVMCAAGCQRAMDRAEFVFLNGAEPETLDPSLITGQPESRIAGALFEGLTSFNQKGQVIPGVAEKWDISPDGRVYIFHLRHDARWSNGQPVTARDFRDTWRRTLTPETAAEYAYQLFYLHNGEAYNTGKIKDFSQVGVSAPDDWTLVVTLDNPTSFFLGLCATTPLYPEPMSVVRRWGDQWIKPGHLVGNGAYQLAEWRINDRIRLVKNPYYWDAAHVGMRSIDALPIDRANTAFNFYCAGQADLILDKGLVPVALLSDLRTRPDFHSAPFLGTYFLRFNVTRSAFKDARVRRAFALVIDKKLIVDKITRAGETPAASLVPPGAAGYQPPPGLERNPDEARRLLAQAGYPGGKGFPLITYLYSTGEVNEAIAVELQSMFKRELGVQISLQRQEWKVYLNSMNNLDFDMCRASWVGDYDDPNTFLDMFVTGGGNNDTGFADPAYDALIADAAKQVDQQKRFAIFRQAEHILISEEAPVCPLYFYVGIQFYNGNRLGGMAANLLDEHPLQDLYWKKDR